MRKIRHWGNGAIAMLAAVVSASLWTAWHPAAAADIVVSGQETSRVGNGRDDDRSLTVESGGSIEVGNSTAVSLGSGTDADKLEIVVENGATVSNNATNGAGQYGTGANTIEVGDHTDITIDGSVLALGTQNNAEAINVHGGSNTITVGVDGIVYAANAAAIWFQDETSTGERNVVDNYGIIQRGGTVGQDPEGVQGNVIGTSRGNGIVFINQSGAKVYGSLQFSGGDDSLIFYAGSLVTGDIDGGGGTNDLTLNGETGSYDVLAGAVKNFTTLDKDGEGTWTISGSLEGFTTVTVNEGVLGLTGNNDGYRGSLIIKDDGTVRARAQSLPTNNPNTGNTMNIENDGVLNFDQRLYDDDNVAIEGSEIDGEYNGQIYGSGQVVKSGGGTVVLNPDAAEGNTYTGGTVIEDGTLAISRDESLGDASGGLTMGTATADGGTNGTLRFDADDITLSADRDITLEDGGGTFNTQGYTATITQDIGGTGALTKTGDGVLVLGDENTASTYNGVNINQGTIAIRADGALGDANGDLNFGTDAADGNNNGTLRLDESVTLSAGRTITLLDGGGTINTNGADVIGTINQDIGGTGSLTKTGAGTLDLTGNGNNNTYAGGTIIADGTVIIDDIGDLGSGGLTFGSATTTGTLQLDDDVDLADAGDVTLAAGGGIIDTNGNEGILSNAIAGSGDLTKTGEGNLDMTAASGADRSYTGATHIEQGSVTIAADSDLGSAGSWLTFGTDGAGATTGTLIVTDDVEMSSRPMYLFDGGGIIDTNGHTVTAEGNISGTGKLTKDGAGVLELYGANGYAGGTDVLEGTLAIDSGAALGAASGALHMFDGTTLRFDADLTLTSRPVEIGDGGAGQTVIVDTNGHDGAIFGAVTGSAGLQKDGEGILALYGSNAYEGGTHVTEGTLAINADASLGASGTDLVMETGTTLRLDRNVDIEDRTITLNGTRDDTVTVDTGEWTGIIGDGADITGDAGLNKEGTGLLVLNGDKTYAGDTNVNAGILQVNGRIGSADRDVAVASGAVLEGIGTVVGTVTNSGLVAPGQPSTGNPIGTLTIDGDYVATDGAGVVISTVLGNDSSPTSVLHITGDVADTNATSTVYVNNLNGQGAETDRGIEIIVVDGYSSGSGFRLDPHHVDDNGVASVVGGAYLYYLKQGDSYDDPASMNNWYLLNVLHNDRPVYQPNVPLFEVYPQVLQQFNKLPTLVQRVGHRSWADADEGIGSEYGYGSLAFDTARSTNPGPAVWTRMEGSLAKFHPTLSSGNANYTMDYGMAHLGIDWPLLGNNCGNQLVLGVTGHMGYGKAWVNSSVGRGKIRTTSPGFGATLTWYGRNGFYADAQTRFNYFRSKIDSHTLLIQSQVDGNHGFGQAYSLELGQIIELGGTWSLTPQGQLSYSKVDFDDFQDRYGTRVSLDRHNSLESRLGIALNWENSCANAAGEVRRTKVYTQFDYFHEFKGTADVHIAGLKFKSKPERTWLSVAVGGTRNWKDDKYSLYGELSARTSTHKFGASHVYSGEVGFRVSF